MWDMKRHVLLEASEEGVRSICEVVKELGQGRDVPESP